MVVTIHQPEHFPYMGFFQKVEKSDLLVILDNVKFRKNYFQNRNKILTKSGQEVWLTVPVEKSSNSKIIKDVQIADDDVWRKKVITTIKDNLNFDASLIYSHNSLIDINMSSIQWALEKMCLKKDLIFASDLNVCGSKSELLVNILKTVGATKYISGPSGRDYLDLSLFDDIEVDFFEPKVDNYYSCLYNLLK